MVDIAFKDFEDGGLDAKTATESSVLTEEKLYASDVFRMHCFKVLPCCKLYNHNWKTCPFLHEGEKAGRRDPLKFRYVGIECQEAKRGECPRGKACPYAHNLFEFWLHPSRYRTQLCNKPSSCRRKVCFFAHDVKELRQPFTDLDGQACDASKESVLPEDVTVDETTSTLSANDNGSQMGPLDVGRLPRSLSAPYQDHRHASPVPSSLMSDTTAWPSPICSPVPESPNLRKCYSNMWMDTPTPARSSPTIRAFRESSDSQLDALVAYGGYLPKSMTYDSQGGCIWTADVKAEMKHGTALVDDGDIYAW